MEESVGPSSRRRILVSIFGPLAVIAVVNVVAILLLRHDTSNWGIHLIEMKWKMAQETGEPVDWLVLGDSTGNQGVIPEILTDNLGGSAHNLCLLADLTATNNAWSFSQNACCSWKTSSSARCFAVASREKHCQALARSAWRQASASWDTSPSGKVLSRSARSSRPSSTSWPGLTSRVSPANAEFAA